MTTSFAADPVPASFLELLALFDGPLAEVRFPDVDGPLLVGIRADVEAAASRVLDLEEQLGAARSALAERQDVMAQKAQRALSYARIFADGDAALLARLDAIVLSRARSTAPAAPVLTPAGKRRGRPPKNADATLFHAPPIAQAASVVDAPMDEPRIEEPAPVEAPQPSEEMAPAFEGLESIEPLDLSMPDMARSVHIEPSHEHVPQLSPALVRRRARAERPSREPVIVPVSDDMELHVAAD
jgi:hypothetical protein